MRCQRHHFTLTFWRYFTIAAKASFKAGLEGRSADQAADIGLLAAYQKAKQEEPNLTYYDFTHPEESQKGVH